MRLLFTLVLAGTLLAWPFAPAARSYTLQYTDRNATTQLRWPTRTINISLSTSLNSPPPNFKPGSDVVGAARRALKSWSEAANIQFNVGFSDALASTQDGVNLITVSPANATLFNSTNAPQGRARITFEPASGNIVEGDVAINPNASAQFSTDGTFGTFDLESTFAHEIGHVLGLEHTAIVGATMQPRQGQNGVYNLPARALSTLSDDERAGMRAIYGPRAGLGALAGTVRYPSGQPAFGAHVWAEDAATGRTVASNIALPNGAYRIDGLTPGQYRVRAEYLNEPVSADQISSRSSGAYQGLSTSTTAPFLTTEVGTAAVAPEATTGLDINVTSGQPFVNPSLLGTNDQLSVTPVPLVPGRTHRILVGGDLVHQVPASGVSVNSPFVSVVQSSYQQLFFGAGLQVISFDVRVSFAAPPGEYSLRLQSPNEVAYVVGGLTIDLPNGVTSGNPIDNATFFVAQHYRDFLNREPDQSGLDFWVNQTTNCGNPDPLVCRVNVSAAFFLSIEFQETGFLVHRLYRASFNRFPRLREFLPDSQRIGRGVAVGVGNWQQQLEANKQAFLNEFVARPEFTAQYPTTLSPEQYVDALNANTGGSLSQAERDALVAGLRTGTDTRATVLRRVAEDADFVAREKSPAFVLMQYFGYLRRNPDDPPNTDFSGFNFWLGKLNDFGGDFVAAELVKGFITSTEYRQRFGPS